MAVFWICASFLIVLIAGCRENLRFSFREVNQVDFNPVESAEELQPTVKVYSDPADILLMLREMEKVRDTRWQSQTGWWHGQKKLSSRLGDLHGVDAEWWFHFDGGQPCPELLQTVYAEDGELMESNLLIRASALPAAGSSRPPTSEEGQPKLVKLPDQTCPDLLNSTLDRVQNMLSGPNRSALTSSEAIIREGSLFITVNWTGPIHEILIVTIDLDNGFIVEETNRIYSLDDAGLLGETTYQYHYDYFDRLPPEIQDRLDSALGS
jgi:hypothetical protein